MSDLILNPTAEDKESFGLLAYVTAGERQRVLHLPLVQRERYFAYLEKRLDKERKSRRSS